MDNTEKQIRLMKEAISIQEEKKSFEFLASVDFAYYSDKQAQLQIRYENIMVELWRIIQVPEFIY